MDLSFYLQLYYKHIEDEQELVNLLVELSLMQCHPCDRLVGFIGAGYRLDDQGVQICTVMELCKYGTLRDCAKLSLPWVLRVRLSLGIRTSY